VLFATYILQYQPSNTTRKYPLEFIVCLVFCYLGDSKTFALEAIRRFMKTSLDKEISRSAFWERLAGDRLKNHLRNVVAELMVT
jgi:siroheme synthase (precorrin-2 oxidase/ferrochelatase)